LLQILKEWKKIWKFSPKSQNYTIIKNWRSFFFFTTNYKILKKIWKISPKFQNQKFVKKILFLFLLKTQKNMTPKNAKICQTIETTNL